MKILLFISLTGFATSQVVIPDATMINKLVDAAFARLDHSPVDGHVSEAEWDHILNTDDADNDGCVTEAEFTSVTHLPNRQLGVQLFNHFDHDSDGCMKLTDMVEEFKSMDTNGDDMVTKQEFEIHFDGFIQKLFGSVFMMGGVAG